MSESEALCAELGITYRQLDYWTRQGYLRPVVKVNPNGKSHGQRRKWPERELQVAREIRRLLAAGFTLEAAARGARALIENGWPQYQTGEHQTMTAETRDDHGKTTFATEARARALVDNGWKQ